jgi:YbgC/YbaW family acyl-CoA thioester hydrolase
VSPFVYRQRVRFPDVDAAGIVFFAALQGYCHDAHEAWLMMLGHPLPSLLERGLGAPIVSIKSDFQHPARHGDELAIAVTLDRLGSRSLTLRYAIDNETTGRYVGTTVMTQVFTDMTRMRSTDPPEDLRRAICAWAAGAE